MKNNSEITTSIILETRWANKKGLYPVKLRVTHDRERRYYRIQKYSLSEKDFEKIMFGKPRGRLKELNLIFNSLERKAVDIIDKIEYFTFDKFEELFFQNSRKGKDVFSYYERYIEQLKEENRFGTAESYQTSMNSVKNFYKKKKLLFEDINVRFLKKYERQMVEAGKSITTVGIYLRPLRKIFNDYMEDVNPPRSIYPFGRNKYVIPKGKNIKKALKIEEIGELYNYDAEQNSETHFAKDMFMLSYFCNGMNLTDIFRLKFKNITGDKILFYRNKTINTSKSDLRPVEVIITDEVTDIINRWRNSSDEPENHVFPLLNGIDDPEKQRKTIKYKTKTINTHLKKIFKDLGFNINASTIYARHSYATIMRNCGASDEFISESVGHQSTQATKNYLAGFEQDIKREYAKKLTAFKKDKTQ